MDKVKVKILFKIPGEDIELEGTTVKGFIEEVKRGYDISKIASVYINGRRWRI